MLQTVFLVFALGSLCLLSLVYYVDDYRTIYNQFSPFLREIISSQFNTSEVEIDKTVLIFAATGYFRLSMLSPGKFVQACPQDIQAWCRLTANYSELESVDAVVYHNRNFNATAGTLDVSAVHVMFTAESPVHESMRYKPDTINWTMTFRRDSDIWSPYGSLLPRTTNETYDLNAIWEMKEENKTAAWMASNCGTPNKRKELINKAASLGLEVDIFGGCGKKMPDCGRYTNDHYACAVKTLSKYMFYFSYENSLCEDYVTEKLYQALKLYMAVPIVIQRKNTENQGIPKDAFIALDDFSSTKEMVDFLNVLKEDKDRYLAYHRWREDSEVEVDKNDGFCDLCQKLRKGNFKSKSHKDLKSWFSTKTCNNKYAFKYLDA